MPIVFRLSGFFSWREGCLKGHSAARSGRKYRAFERLMSQRAAAVRRPSAVFRACRRLRRRGQRPACPRREMEEAPVMNTFFYLFLTSPLMAWNPSYAAGHQPVSPACGPELFKSADSLEPPLPLKEFAEILADLKIYSTADFISLKREEGIPDGITGQPLQAYPELQRKWDHLWDRVRAIRRANGEEPEEREKPPFGELEALMRGMVNELGEEGAPEEKFPEEIEIGSVRPPQKKKKEKDRPSERIKAKQKKKKSGRAGAYANKPSGASRKAARPSHRDSQEEKKKRLLELTAENSRITIAEMTEKMSLSKSAIERMIAVLRQEGRLARIGSDKSGYWQMLREGESSDSYDPYKERKKKILDLISENARITINEMAEKMSLSEATIGRMTAVLKQEGRLARMGANPNRYWQIPQEGESPDFHEPQKERGKKILELTAEDEKTTAAEMAEEMSLSEATIKRGISVLKQEGRLARIGANASGYWKILREGESPPDAYDSQKERGEKLLALTAESSRITIAEMAGRMSLSETTIKQIISVLKQEGRLARIGADKNGYWQALREGESPGAYDPQEERREKILELIAKNNKITRAETAEKAGCSISTVDNILASLKQEGRLARVGAGRHGYWQILREGDSPDAYDFKKERREKKLLALIAENERITIAEMAERMSLSKAAINKMIAVLKQKNLLARAGSNAGGYWVILEN